ncbi:MAG: hypothetical protein GXZ01_04130 [Clostridiaceae bacterium]|nr:hypothetical protein [Clostridiaceae bacterium]
MYLTGRSDNSLYMFLPAVSCLFIIPCHALWRTGVRHYRSTGS